MASNAANEIVGGTWDVKYANSNDDDGVSLSSITSTIDMQTTPLNDVQLINVIDTLTDSSIAHSQVYESEEDEREFPDDPDIECTIVSNDKTSAGNKTYGNAILSRATSCRVTSTTNMGSTLLSDGQLPKESLHRNTSFGYISSKEFADTSNDHSGGRSSNDKQAYTPSNSETRERTIVLVGRTGNGKSATGNSILGKKAFDSRSRSTGVTSTTDMQSATLNDGQLINVIDTIGLFDSCLESDLISKEIVKCVSLAKKGIHAILLVFSVRTRFTTEEATTLQILHSLFGSDIINYVIVVFTGGDELDTTLEEHLSSGCPTQLQNILDACKGRCVLFDNKIHDQAVIMKQRQNLVDLIEEVVKTNGGNPYTNNAFKALRESSMKLSMLKEDDDLEGHTSQKMSNMNEEELKRSAEMVDRNLRERLKMIERECSQEKQARYRTEKELKEEKQARKRVEKRVEKLEEDQWHKERNRQPTLPGCPIL